MIRNILGWGTDASIQQTARTTWTATGPRYKKHIDICHKTSMKGASIFSYSHCSGSGQMYCDGERSFPQGAMLLRARLAGSKSLSSKVNMIIYVTKGTLLIHILLDTLLKL